MPLSEVGPAGRPYVICVLLQPAFEFGNPEIIFLQSGGDDLPRSFGKVVDVTMDRAGAGLISNSEYFASTLRARRNSAKGLSRIFQKIIGLEAKLNQYQAGEFFIQKVEESGGTELLDRTWERPENLPLMDEIQSPQKWIDRIANDETRSLSSQEPM